MDYPTFIDCALMQQAGFTDVDQYPQAVVEQLIKEATCLLPASRWAQCNGCDRQALAIKYLVAHRLVQLAQAGVIGGGSAGSSSTPAGVIPGQVTSISASQGSQSVSWSAPDQGNNSSKRSNWLNEGVPYTYWWGQLMGLINTSRVVLGCTV